MPEQYNPHKEFTPRFDTGAQLRHEEEEEKAHAEKLTHRKEMLELHKKR